MLKIQANKTEDFLMALDTVAIQCITNELNQTIIGGRIEKIYQPERDEITLNIRTFTQASSPAKAIAKTSSLS